MLTAKEARAQAEDNKRIAYGKEVAEIEKAINNAVAKGETSYYRSFGIHKEVQDHLKKLGYKLENQSTTMDGTLWRITW